ncbi:flavonoid 3'-monooxygenase CYP75B137 [Cryptomeria japonica]|uniref:flavonoid 3'-monooxygenase CYP75B137 n=1 Tax=Cryptomeria japonica TaxID=3369 RepID=UPI0027DA6F17|nr:flavonoid 3'-monooxygenase CYP75B137 [Cryptomeria japonica]
MEMTMSLDTSKLFSFFLSFSVSVTLPLIALLACLYFSNGGKAKTKLPPGPRGLPVLGSLLDLGSNPHHSLCALSKRYGGLMYLKLGSTPTIIASSQEAATAILKTFDSDFSNRPQSGSAVADILLYNRSDITWSPHSQWPFLRKLCIFHLLTPKCLEKWQESREEEMALLLASIFRLRAAAVNVGDFVNVFTSNVIGQMTLRMRLFDENNAEAEHFRELMDDFLSTAARFRIGDFVPFLARIGLGGSLDEMKSLHKRLDQFLVRKMEEQRRMPLPTKDDGNKDFLQILHQLKYNSVGEGRQLSESNIKGILLNMMAAGTDTATRSVEWAMSELIRRPHLMKKVREEVDAVVGMEERVTESHLPHLKYLQAVVTETLRLHPPTPLMLPHASPDSSREIMGHFIPPNSHVMVNVWAIARDPNAWEKPLEFDPDRFVDNPVHLDGRDFRIIPFGAGGRMCPGYNLGLRMIQFALASFVHAFDWSLPSGEEVQDLDMSEKYEVSIHRKVPLKLFVSPRLPTHLYNSQQKAGHM